MATATRRLLAGNYTPQFRGDGVWRLTADAQPQWILYLRGVGTRDGGEPAMRMLEPGGSLEIDWHEHGAGAMLTLRGASPRAGRQVRQLHASVAILQEPVDGLYAALPLADRDPAARRFWIRVMRLASVPGGGRLIAWIARRRASRAAASPAAMR